MFDDETIPGQPAASLAASAGVNFGRAGREEPSALEREVVDLFDQYQDRLLRYLLSLGMTAADGEEIIQEAFLALFKHLLKGKPRHNLRAWLFQVSHNLALKQRTAIHRSRLSLVECGGTAAENFFMDPALNAEDRISRHQRSVKMFAVWQALPEQDRRFLALRAEGLTYREITQVLDMSLGAISLSLARSLARFARADDR
jgi:RNA polymerase sigma-70 factor, ECF subfamily